MTLQPSSAAHPCEVAHCACRDFIWVGTAVGYCQRDNCGHRDVEHNLAPTVQAGAKDWSDVFGAVASDLIFGFDIFDLNDDSDDAYQQINGRLDQISDSIKQLQKQMDEVINILKQLPAELLSVLDKHDADTWLRTAVADIGNIRQMSSTKATYNANRTSVRDSVNDLAKAIYQVWGNLGTGWGSAAMTSSAIGSWVQLLSMVLRDPVLFPDHPPVTQNWLCQFIQGQFGNLLTNTNVCLNNADDIIQNVPGEPPQTWDITHCWIFDQSCESFKYIKGQSSAQTYASSGGYPGNRTLMARLAGSPIRPKYGSASGPGPFNDPANVRAALSAWSATLDAQRLAINTLYTLTKAEPDFTKIRTALQIS